MTRSEVELIVRSVIRDYGIQSDITRIALFVQAWKIEVADRDGTRTTFTAVDSSPHNMRRSVMTAFGVEVQ